MNSQKKIDFNSALETAIKLAQQYWETLGDSVIILRDLYGRIRVVLPGDKPKDTKFDNFAKELSSKLGAYGYPPDNTMLFGNSLIEGDALFGAELTDRRLYKEENGRKIWLLDRQITGQDWGRAPFETETQTRRFTFFGIKGGVGRSTALIVWAWWLAKQKKKNVLIFDLDLESPGTSSTLLPHLPYSTLPEYGIVDWFVEDGVGQAEMVEESMVSRSPLATDFPGEIRVVPAFGSNTGDYLSKLARCYREQGGKNPASWSQRLQRMVKKIEEIEKPDVVLFDSRAGLHDIAAVLVTRMGADTFLFALPSEQTWTAYSFLFSYWKENPQMLLNFRDRLKMVAGMVPETEREQYLKRFRSRSWDLFRDHLYEEIDAKTTDAFSFDLMSEEAPHYPLIVFWNRALQEFDPIATDMKLDEQIIQAAFGGFLEEADRMLLPKGDLA